MIPQVPPEREAKLTRLAADTGRAVDQVAFDLWASSMDHDEWTSAIEADARPLHDGCCR